MRTRTTVAILFFVVAVLGTATLGGALGLETPSAVGADGTVVRLLNGLASVLVPEDASLNPDAPILVLEILSPGNEAVRHVVPATADFDPEDSESLVFEESSGILYLLWQSHLNGIHPRLYLASFDGSAWSETIIIGNGPFDAKGMPQLVMVVDDEGRTVLNVAWWQQSGPFRRKLFSPVILDFGSRPAATPIFDFSDFFGPVEEDGGSYPEEIDEFLTFVSGRDDHTVAGGWLDSVSGRLRTATVQLLPRALGALADEARAQIIIIGLTTGGPPGEFAALVADAIMESGTSTPAGLSALHSSTLVYLAETVGEMIKDEGPDVSPEEIEALAEKARAQIIIIGSRIDFGGLSDEGARTIIEVPATGNSPAHLLAVTPLLDLEVPEIGDDPQILISPSANRLLIVWENEGSVIFTESKGGGWGDPVAIELTGDLDRETVLGLLRSRL